MMRIHIQLMIILLLSILTLNLLPHSIDALYIHEPSYLRGTLPFSIAQFGLPYVTNKCDTYELVEATDSLACSSLIDDNDIKLDESILRYSGKIVFVKRGACSFAQKALFVQQAGAVGMLVWNTEDAILPKQQQQSLSKIIANAVGGTGGENSASSLGIKIIQTSESGVTTELHLDETTRKLLEKLDSVQLQQTLTSISQQHQQQQQETATTTLITMSDDGNGKHVRIRSAMIGNKDGIRIKEALDAGHKVRISLGYCSLLKFSYFM